MIKKHKYILIFLALIVACGAFYYGATTAPNSSNTKEYQVASRTQSTLESDQKTITSVIEANYPLVKDSYKINKGKSYEGGRWFGTTLSYKGSDNLNRDTLRVLLEKKQGIWVIRSKPPTPLLSVVDYPDVPRSVLSDINKPISLPAEIN